MDNGLIHLNMVMYGFRLPARAFSPMAVAGTGYSLIMAGHGFQIIVGDGLRSTMEIGSLMPLWDGIGYRAINGLRHGLAGEAATDIMAGHR
jgi:hypothetical protein